VAEGTQRTQNRKRGIALFEEGKKCGMEEHARKACGAMKGVLLGCK